MKRFAMAFALMCALSTSIFAGNMPTGGFVDPPPPPLAGNMPTGGKSEEPLTTSSTLLVSVIVTIITTLR